MSPDFRRDLLIRWDDAPAGVLGLLESAHAIGEQDLRSQALQVGEGLWPGIRRPPNVAGRGDETVSASVEPWVDANGYLAACLTALDPRRIALVRCKPDSEERVVPYDSLELALIEARVCGGNAVLTPEKRLRDDLTARKPEAVTAFKNLSATARWLREHEELLGRPRIPAITMLVEESNQGPKSPTMELANLLFRRNGSPDVRSAGMIPAPSPDRLAIVCAGSATISTGATAKLLQHARLGATVVTDDARPAAWWRAAVTKPQRVQQDREFYPLGKGSIVVYKRRIADPSEFALDVIDIVGHPRRAVRLWNAPAVIPVATAGVKAGEAILHAVNYGGPIDVEVQARVQGHYSAARLLAPGGQPVSLPVAKRGSTTEVMIPRIRRLATVLFDGAALG